MPPQKQSNMKKHAFGTEKMAAGSTFIVTVQSTQTDRFSYKKHTHTKQSNNQENYLVLEFN